MVPGKQKGLEQKRPALAKSEQRETHKQLKSYIEKDTVKIEKSKR